MGVIKCIMLFLVVQICASYKILAVFPYNARSHHIYFSSLVEELAARNHEVTVINYFPVKKHPNLKQISLKNDINNDTVIMDEFLGNFSTGYFGEFFNAYITAREFKIIANKNCKMLVNNQQVQDIMSSDTKYDVMVVEQFTSDCHLFLANKIQAPIVGMAAHVLLPWHLARLGAPDHPAFVPSYFIGTGSRPNLWNRIKNFIINNVMKLYYRHVIQELDYDIVKSVYPSTPDLEVLARNISLMLVNQYFPLTGSRLYGSNVIEVGGLHIKSHSTAIEDKELLSFINNSINGVVLISFGTVAKRFPPNVLEEILKVTQKSKMDFVWKVDDVKKIPNVTKNVLLRSWLPQPSVLCHPNVKAFISHSGIHSSAETMQCGKPIVSVPMFADQYSNAVAAEEIGLGVIVKISNLNEQALSPALEAVLQERYQKRAKELSNEWRDRRSPMDTAIQWIEFVARNPNANFKPPTVDLPLYQYFMLEFLAIFLGQLLLLKYFFSTLLRFVKEFWVSLNGSKRKIE